jgi:hypothetical protein
MAKVRADVDRRAAEGAPDLGSCYRLTKQKQLGSIDWPYNLIANREAQCGVDVFCWLFRDEMLARFESEIDAKLAGQKTYALVERQRAEAQLRADILAGHHLIAAICFDQNIAPPCPLHWMALLGVERAPDAEPMQHPDVAGMEIKGVGGNTVGVPVSALLGAKGE